MKKLSLLVAILSGMVLTGCTTTQITLDEAKSVSPLTYAVKSNANDATVTIMRDGGMLGCASPAYVSVDEKRVAKLWASEKAQIYLPAGKYFFKMEMGVTSDYAKVELKDQDEAVLRIYGDVVNGAAMSQIK